MSSVGPISELQKGTQTSLSLATCLPERDRATPSRHTEAASSIWGAR